jgi:hypothetical protein
MGPTPICTMSTRHTVLYALQVARLGQREDSAGRDLELRRLGALEVELLQQGGGTVRDDIRLVERFLRARGLADHVASSSLGITATSAGGSLPSLPTTVTLGAGSGNPTQGSSVTSEASQRGAYLDRVKHAQLNPVPLDLTPVDLTGFQTNLPQRFRERDAHQTSTPLRGKICPRCFTRL